MEAILSPWKDRARKEKLYRTVVAKEIISVQRFYVHFVLSLGIKIDTMFLFHPHNGASSTVIVTCASLLSGILKKLSEPQIPAWLKKY